MLFRSPLRWLGWLLVALGLLFIGQGFGVVRWPASSFMIDQYRWVGWGAVIASVGVIALVISRPRPRR